jgi:hypothetical protein
MKLHKFPGLSLHINIIYNKMKYRLLGLVMNNSFPIFPVILQFRIGSKHLMVCFNTAICRADVDEK